MDYYKSIDHINDNILELINLGHNNKVIRYQMWLGSLLERIENNKGGNISKSITRLLLEMDSLVSGYREYNKRKLEEHVSRFGDRIGKL